MQIVNRLCHAKDDGVSLSTIFEEANLGDKVKEKVLDALENKEMLVDSSGNVISGYLDNLNITIYFTTKSLIGRLKDFSERYFKSDEFEFLFPKIRIIKESDSFFRVSFCDYPKITKKGKEIFDFKKYSTADPFETDDIDFLFRINNADELIKIFELDNEDDILRLMQDIWLVYKIGSFENDLKPNFKLKSSEDSKSFNGEIQELIAKNMPSVDSKLTIIFNGKNKYNIPQVDSKYAQSKKIVMYVNGSSVKCMDDIIEQISQAAERDSSDFAITFDTYELKQSDMGLSFVVNKMPNFTRSNNADKKLIDFSKINNGEYIPSKLAKFFGSKTVAISFLNELNQLDEELQKGSIKINVRLEGDLDPFEVQTLKVI